MRNPDKIMSPIGGAGHLGRLSGAASRVLSRVLPLLLLAGTTAFLNGCDDDDPVDLDSEETTFEVRIENVSESYAYTSSGLFNTPAGSDAPGPVMPGESYDFEFHAGPGSRVSFATMFVQSNDLFYAPDGDGIEVYDGSGVPRSGNVTAEVYLWDAGTEINQEPGTGPDQAPRQGGADTGAPDPDNSVRLATDDFGNLPTVEEAVEVTLTHLGGTQFRIRIANVADDETLPLSGGGFAPVIIAPGVWTVGGDTDPLFTQGQPDPGLGLEALAEDGAVAGYHSELDSRTGLTSPLAPGVFAVHSGGSVLFDAGMPDPGLGMEALAEDGDPSDLAAAVAARTDVTDNGVFNTPEGASSPGPAFPGDAYVFMVTAVPGDRLSFATMLVQTNDLFYAPAEGGVSLFTLGGMPVTGEITGMTLLWDAGTEANEFPGVGPNQAPRQSGPQTGVDETEAVLQVNDGYTYPAVDRVLRVTITPMDSGS